MSAYGNQVKSYIERYQAEMGGDGLLGLSEFLCVRHTMTARSQYAETKEAGAAGEHP